MEPLWQPFLHRVDVRPQKLVAEVMELGRTGFPSGDVERLGSLLPYLLRDVVLPVG